MAKDPFLWTKIITYSRCIMHFVKMILVYLLGLAKIGFFTVKDNLLESFSMCSLIGCLIGFLLLHGIIKENRKTILAYLILGGITLGTRQGFQLYEMYNMLLKDHRTTAILWTLSLCIFFAFEWLMFFFVVKFRRTLQEYALFLPRDSITLEVQTIDL